jgi:3-hydroxyisobutyrate dehydrogenase-like beta-hydroxyacid dehydrogenase
VIGILHPGTMGAALGAALVGAGHQVAWCSTSRSPATARRAADARLTDLQPLGQLLDACATVISICPPAEAVAIAEKVAGYRGLFVDANAVSPETSQQIGGIVTRCGGRYVDGSVVGPPPTVPGRTRLYLSGADAHTAARLFTGTLFEARVLEGDTSSASALKMAYAAWTKGSGALLLAIREMAAHFGVEEFLRAEWDETIPGLTARSDQCAAAAGAKAWRWVFEMEEVAATLDAAGMPGEFGRAAAAVYGRMARS